MLFLDGSGKLEQGTMSTEQALKYKFCVKMLWVHVVGMRVANEMFSHLNGVFSQCAI